MHTTTTRLNTLVAKKNNTGDDMIRVWSCWIVRPKALLLASQWLLLAAVLSCIAWGYQSHSPFGSLHANAGVIILLVTLQICCYANGLASVIVAPSVKLFVAKALVSLGMGLLLITPLFVAFPGLFPGYGWAASAVLLSTVCLLILRPLLCWLIRRKKFGEGLLILGTGDLAGKFRKELANLQLLDANPPLHLGTANSASDQGAVINYEELRAITLRERISRIVVAEADAHNSKDLAVALLDCKLAGLAVEQASESYEQLSEKIWLEALRPESLLYSEGFRPSKHYLLLKRAYDALCALLIIIVSAPLLAVIGILVKLDSAGPILLRQVRVGLHGKEFVLLKFRTMRQDAEVQTGPVWACQHDKRMTRVGKYLRKYRLDELPQAFNVLRGEMSLVGPRPERPYFVELLSAEIPYYGLRHSVNPGITGWAQVLYPYGASVKDAYEKLQYDLYYAKHMSLGFDLRILLSTVQVVLFGRGQ